jgi:riboflavin synthase alpha subunit
MISRHVYMFVRLEIEEHQAIPIKVLAKADHDVLKCIWNSGIIKRNGASMTIRGQRVKLEKKFQYSVVRP